LTSGNSIGKVTNRRDRINDRLERLWQIVSALIGSGLLVTTFSSFYNEFFNKPHFNIIVEGDPTNIHRDIITIKNDGRQPATNLGLTIQTPRTFSLIDIFSTAKNTSVTNINSTFFSVHVPSFVHGEGSIIRIVIDVRYTGLLLGGVVNVVDAGSLAQTIGISKGSVIRKIAGQDLTNLTNFHNILHANLGKKIEINWLQSTGKNTTRLVSLPPFIQPGKQILGVFLFRSPGDYTAYGVYNEGSFKKVFLRVPCNSFIPQSYTLSYGQKNYEDYLQFKDQFYSYLLWPFLVAISIVIITFPQIYNKLFRTFRRDQIIFLTGIVEEMIMIRNILKKNLLTTSHFTEKWTSISCETKRQIIGDISDYLLVDDFYTLLTKRNTYVINNKIENYYLNQYNEECIQFSEKALSGVDWKKYRITGRISRPPKSSIETLLIAFIGGLVLPGIGHIYIGRWKKGLIIMAVFYVLAFLYVEGIVMQYESLYLRCSDPSFIITIMTYLYFPMVGIWIWQGLDARRLAVKLNKQQHVE
jgi:hypothetical protein